MPIQLDKILANIAEEKTLHPNYPNPTKKEMDDAWTRVGKNNKLSVHECRSIFKVLQKKYEQERLKDSSAWKLFNVMDEIHKKVEVKAEVKHEGEQEVPMEEDEEYEMLEVQEEDEQSANISPQSESSTVANTGTGGSARSESPSKSMKSGSSSGSPEKEEKATFRNATTLSAVLREDRKLLNSLPNVTAKISIGGASQSQINSPSQKKITLKKLYHTSPTTTLKSGAASQNISKITVRSGNNSMLEVGQTIQLPESMKRKLSEDHVPHPSIKRSNTASVTVAAQQQPSPSSRNSSTSLSPDPKHVKEERDDEKLDTQAQTTHGINIITIPANPTITDLGNGAEVGTSSTNMASNSTNGYSPRLEKIDFRNDIIFDTGSINGVVGRQQQNSSRVNHHTSSEVINLGNFNNALPPTFFKNLCNSSRHEALGLYVANVMNRLGVRSAAKLELGILRAIIDVQSDELGD